MDMIPFGQLQLMNPKPEGVSGHESKSELREMMDSGKLERMELLSGKGFTRWSEFTHNQMYTFITLRALSASPLMMGGDLPSLDDFSLKLITNKEVLACNQNGVMGSLKYENQDIEVWNTPEKNTNNGWIGIFNRAEETKSISLNLAELGLNPEMSYQLLDVWNNAAVKTPDFTIQPYGVVFLTFSGE